jgi:hypothetical protein
MDTFDRQVARWSGIVGLIAGAGVVITYAGGAISQIRHFRWYFKVPLIVFAAIFVLVVVLQLVVYARHRGDASGAQGSAIHGPQLVHFGGGSATDVTIEGNVMNVGESTPVEAVSPIPSSPALLLGLADEMGSVSGEALERLGRGATTDSGLERTPEDLARAWEEERERRHAAMNDYRVNLHPRVVQLYEQARSRGYPDQELDRAIRGPAANEIMAARASTRLGVVAEQIRFDVRHGEPEGETEHGNG